MSGLGITCRVCDRNWKGPLDPLPGCLNPAPIDHCPLANRRLQAEVIPHEIAPPAVSLSVEWQCPVCKVGVMGLAPPACMADTEPANCPRAAAPAMVIP